MSKVIVDISMSLDGFATAANVRAEAPLGDGGERLHAWLHGDDRDRDQLRRAQEAVGVIVCGRRTYDHSLPWWGETGPSGEARVPVVVVTGRGDAPAPGSVYTFVDGVGPALERARELAGESSVSILGGPDVIRQCLAAGLVDELWLHVAPVLLGDGVRLFEQVGADLEPLEAVQTAAATHVRYRIRAADVPVVTVP